MFHQKRNGISAFAATKAFENFFGRRNGERWSFFVMKRTKSEVVGAPFFQANKTANDFNNINAGKNLLYGILRDHNRTNIGMRV